MDEFVRGLDLLLQADAGKLLVIALLLFLGGGVLLGWSLVRLATRLVQGDHDRGNNSDRLFELFVKFTANIEDAVKAIAIVVTAVQAVAERLEESHKLRREEHADMALRQDVMDSHMTKIDTQILDLIEAVKKLPDQINALADKTPDRTELMRRIDELEARLIQHIEDALTKHLADEAADALAEAQADEDAA